MDTGSLAPLILVQVRSHNHLPQRSLVEYCLILRETIWLEQGCQLGAFTVNTASWDSTCCAFLSLSFSLFCEILAVPFRSRSLPCQSLLPCNLPTCPASFAPSLCHSSSMQHHWWEDQLSIRHPSNASCQYSHHHFSWHSACLSSASPHQLAILWKVQACWSFRTTLNTQLFQALLFRADPSLEARWFYCYRIRCLHSCSNLLERRGQCFQPFPRIPIAALQPFWYVLELLPTMTNLPWRSFIVAQTRRLLPFRQRSFLSVSFSWRMHRASL